MRRSLPEWAVQHTSELGGIAHESASVAETSIYQALLDRMNAPVHHVARCDAVRASTRVVEGHLDETCDGGFGVDCSIRVEDSTLTV